MGFEGKPGLAEESVNPGTAAVLESWKRERGGLALALARDDALVFGDLEGQHRHPERFSRLWNQAVTRAIRDGVDVTEIRLHDLRHRHATILLLLGCRCTSSASGWDTPARS